MMNNILEKLDIMIPNPRCELEYHKDYELLIATVLSAQCTDARVNMVTKELFSKYDIFSLATADIEDIKKIIKPVGTFTRKSLYIKEIAIRLVKDYNGNEVTSIEGLNYVSVVDGKGNTIKGFDITTTTGIYYITKNREITTDTELIEKWDAKVTYVNLSENQNNNLEKELKGYIRIEKAE